MHHEQAFIATFVKSSKRERYRDMVASAILRPKFLSRLAHFADCDTRHRLPISGGKLTVTKIARELQSRHSPNVVFLISEDPALDRRELPVAEALQEVVGRGMGTIVSCRPGHLAFVETEDERFILDKPALPEKASYVRFVVGRKDSQSHVEQGIFHAVGHADHRQLIADDDADELDDLRYWFNENLEKPTAFGRKTLPLGICWFKLDATEHISRIWQMVSLLERNGVYIKTIRTDKPGYVVYEDEWQIVAEPFRKGTMSRK